MTRSFRAFNVYRPRVNGGYMLIDTIFYTNDNITAEEVKGALIDHDGYVHNIIVVEDKK